MDDEVTVCSFELNTPNFFLFFFFICAELGGAVQLIGVLRLLLDPENMLATANVSFGTSVFLSVNYATAFTRQTSTGIFPEIRYCQVLVLLILHRYSEKLKKKKKKSHFIIYHKENGVKLINLKN